MEMLKLTDMKDYEKLPVTKWKIKQPDIGDVSRENPLMTGDDVVDLYSVFFLTKYFLLRHIQLH